MFSKNMPSELCCFGAVCSGVTAFLLVVFALDFTIDAPMSDARLLVLAGAGLAFVLMTVLTGIAVRMASNSPCRVTQASRFIGSCVNRSATLS